MQYCCYHHRNLLNQCFHQIHVTVNVWSSAWIWETFLILTWSQPALATQVGVWMIGWIEMIEMSVMIGWLSRLKWILNHVIACSNHDGSRGNKFKKPQSLLLHITNIQSLHISDIHSLHITNTHSLPMCVEWMLLMFSEWTLVVSDDIWWDIIADMQWLNMGTVEWVNACDM